MAEGLSLITEITSAQINIWRLQSVKLTAGCEIEGESSDCSKTEFSYCTVRAYTAIQLVPLIIFLRKSDVV